MSTVCPEDGRISTHVLSYSIAIVAAGSLVIASAGFGATFAWSVNQHQLPSLAYFAVLMALGLEMAKPLAVQGIFNAARQHRFGEGAALFILAAVAVGYSLTAELQLMARSRADAIAERQAGAVNPTDVREKLKRLRGDLAGMAPARSIGEMEPLISAKIAATKGADCNQWVPDSRTRAACLDLAQLRAEAARASQRAEITAKIEAAESALSSANGQKVADPSAAALVTYLEALGVHASPSNVGDWLTLIGVFALEVGSMFAAVLVGAARRDTQDNRTPSVSDTAPGAPGGNTDRNAETPAQTGNAAPRDTPTETPCFGVSSTPQRIVVAEHPAERLVSLLREKGGEVFGSQRTLGAAVGISGSHLNRMLHDLAAAGHVTVMPGRSGTRVALVTP